MGMFFLFTLLFDIMKKMMDVMISKQKERQDVIPLL